MIKSTKMLLEELKDYANPNTKIARMVRDGELFQLKRGLYETDRSVSPHCLAASICSPSYISFEYALSWHGLIPEAVRAVTSASFGKRRTKTYRNVFGRFTFRDVPRAAFPWMLLVEKEGEYYYRIAEKEKALLDKLYIMPPVSNAREMEELLLEDLRIDEDDILTMDYGKISWLAPRYRCSNADKLVTALRRIQHHDR